MSPFTDKDPRTEAVISSAANETVDESVIQDVASWVLRIGVVASVTVMLIGLIICIMHGTPTVQTMESVHFNDHLLALWRGLLQGDGLSIIQVGIVLLILTPIARVAVSIVLFWLVDHDVLYALVTLVVLALTVSALFFLR